MDIQTFVGELADLGERAKEGGEPALQSLIMITCALAICPFKERNLMLVTLSKLGIKFLEQAEQSS